jgi:hypothetical protein
MTSNLEKFTLITKVRLSKSPKGKPRTIVSHSSCGCYALMLDEKG